MRFPWKRIFIFRILEYFKNINLFSSNDFRFKPYALGSY